MDELAKKLNETIKKNSETFYYHLSDFGRNIFMPMGIIMQSQEAKKLATKYNATIGEAKENGKPMYLKSIYKFFNHLSPEQIFPYASPHGVPALREMWQEKIVKENPSLKSKDSISMPITTQAITNGLMLIGDLFVNQGDEIILPDMLWDNYSLIYEVRYRAKIETFPFFDSSLSGFNVKALDEAIKKSKKEKIILILNFPNNPTGYTPTAKEAEEIVKAVVKYAEKDKKILIVSDDSYYGLFYENGLIEGSIFSKFVGIHPNIAAVKVDGFTKEYYVWGFRIGFITFGDYWQNKDAYKALEDKTAASIRCSISNCSNTKQSILLALKDSTEYVKEREEKYVILRSRADKVKEVVYNKKYLDCWDVYPFNSGYFMCLRLKGVDANELRLHALNKYGVGTISIGKTDLRVAFSCIEVDQIEDIFDIIAKSIRELRGN